MDVAELAQAFVDAKQDKHFELVQRVQALMGQGVDVSSLFLPMVSSASTRDIPTKKAAFNFLSAYGYQNEELCILGINTLHQDSTDPDPVVRALALRTLCSLGHRNVLRFMLQPLYKGLRDKNAHVRKTAVMGCVSIFELDPLFVLESDIVDRLYHLIRDRDGQVAVSAILALETILKDEGGLVINQTMARHLLSRLTEWTSGQLVVIMGILCRYRPETDEEIYDIMNDIDDGLQHTSTAVQMATLRLFIFLTQNLAEIQDQVMHTIFETLSRQLTSSSPELVYASLDHLRLMVQKSVSFYESEMTAIEALFCRQDDPTAIKTVKVRILGEVATRSSDAKLVQRIIQELLRYATLRYYKNNDTAKKVFHHAHRPPSQRHQQHQHQQYQQRQQHVTESEVSIACRAVETLGHVGACKAAFSPAPGPAATPEKSLSRAGSAGSSSESNSAVHAWGAVMDALFKAITHVSGLEMAAAVTSSEGLSPSEKPPLPIKDADIERILSTVVHAIEECWQVRYDFQQRTGILCRAGGILTALQVKSLGSILLRHLDQDELDRQAKRNKPLRMSYDSPAQGLGALKGSIGLHATMSSLSLSSSTVTNPEDDDGDYASHEKNTIGSLSNVARVAGIRILIMEEALAQSFLRRQLQTAPQGSPERQRRQEKWDKGREMRNMYAMLLQQQVQEMVHLVARRCRRTRRKQQRRQPRAAGDQTSSATPLASKMMDDAFGGHQSQIAKEFEDSSILQLAVLRLGCCLVATSLDTKDKSPQEQSSGDGTLDNILGSDNRHPMVAELASIGAEVTLEQRLAILDLLLETLLLPEDELKEGGNTVIGPVSRDVRDRARWISQQFYTPFKTALAPDSQKTGRSATLEAASLKAVDAFIELYGVSESSKPTRGGDSRDGIYSHLQSEDSRIPIDLLEQERQDRLFEHGFSTMAVHLF